MIIIDVKKRLNTFDMDVDLRLGQELTILAGPNGSGKSTLLKMVAGLERPDEGRIEVSGCVFFDGETNIAPEKRRVGYISQENSLFPWLTVEENISFGLKRTEKKRSKCWLEKLISELNLEKLLSRSISGLSGGEAQRVALARALAPRPRVLLLDEPFSSVDPKKRPHLRRFLKEIQQDWDIPVLMVTHDHAEAYTLGERIFELNEGKIAEHKEKGKIIKMPFISY